MSDTAYFTPVCRIRKKERSCLLTGGNFSFFNLAVMELRSIYNHIE